MDLSAEFKMREEKCRVNQDNSVALQLLTREMAHIGSSSLMAVYKAHQMPFLAPRLGSDQRRTAAERLLLANLPGRCYGASPSPSLPRFTQLNLLIDFHETS